MNPEQLSAKDTESGHQKALFAWAAMARLYGFEVADNMSAYSAKGLEDLFSKMPEEPPCIPCLRWLHAIPNGGYRDPVTAARMKAEGVKAGVPDVFLPVARRFAHGLYIEMKRPGSSSRQSEEQKQFEQHCTEYTFAYHICKTWREAANVVKTYLT